MKTPLKASLIALAIASFPIGSHAAGLGQINVFSGIGQPLRAEIPVSATPQELQSLAARVAAADAFKAANLSYSAAAASIQASVDARGGRPVIRLSSSKPINDPFVELLVELNWASGQLARGYTFLLDPVDLAAPKPAAARVETAAAQPPASRAAPPQAVARETERPAANAAAPERYAVKRGDTLRSIAGSTVPASANLDQMLIALFRANPGAFDGANINRLKAGAVLAVPAAESVQAIDAAGARREVLAHAADFEAYRRRLAAAAGARAEASDEAGGQASGGSIVPRVEESRPAAEPKDKVRVSRSEGQGAGDTSARLQALEEELATREKALEDANARLAQLEQSIRDMQKLLEVRNASLAQAQQQAGGARSEGTAPAAAPAAPPAPAAAAVEPPPAEKPAAAPAATEPQAAAAPAESGSAPEAKPAPVAEQPPPPPKPKKPKAAPPPPPEEPGFLDSLLENPTTLAAGGGALALLLVLAGLKLRRRRSGDAVEAADTELGGTSAPESGAVFGATGGQSVDTGNSVLMTDFSQSGLAAIDTDEGVDPVAEADVYMAYGRDAQAEEILQDALKSDPDRAAIYLKLLEIYAQRKSGKPFETVATELYARTGGRGTDWERAAVMGRKLDPDNPLYGIQGAVRTEGLAAPTTELPPLAGLGLAAATAVAAAQPDTRTPAGPSRDEAAEGEPLKAEAAKEGVPAESASDPMTDSLPALDFTNSLPIEPSQSQLKDTWTMPGDLSQFVRDEADKLEGRTEAAGAEAADVDTPELPADLDVIDFDLDLDEPAAVATEIVEEAQSEIPTAAGEAGVEAAEPISGDEGPTFDLDIGGLDAVTEPAAAPLEVPEVSEEPAADVNIVSAFDFELPDLDLEPPAGGARDLDATMVDAAPLSFEPETTVLGMDLESAAEGREGAAAPDLESTRITPEAPSFDPDATALDLDFELPDMSDVGSGVPQGTSPAGASGSAGVPEMDLEQTSFDSNLLDFDFDIEPQAEDAVPPPSLDLTAIDLDLGSPDGADEPAPAAAAPAPQSAAADAAQAENFEEVETKLELARAYEDMGDKEGALELLEEVLREGGTQQQASAREMMARLG